MNACWFSSTAGAFLLGSLLSGCATIMSGDSQTVSFNSAPDGAEVSVGGRVIGKTPITTSLKKASGQPLVFSKDGYKPLTMQLETRMDSWFWGNIVLGGLIGSITDDISGAIHEYSPSQYMVTLTPIGAGRLEERTIQPETHKTREFIVVSYRELLKDFRRGEGPYLGSLLDLLKIQPPEKPEAIKKIKALSDVYTNIPEFADRVIDLYRDRASPTGGAPQESDTAQPWKTQKFSDGAL